MDIRDIENWIHNDLHDKYPWVSEDTLRKLNVALQRYDKAMVNATQPQNQGSHPMGDLSPELRDLDNELTERNKKVRKFVNGMRQLDNGLSRSFGLAFQDGAENPVRDLLELTKSGVDTLIDTGKVFGKGSSFTKTLLKHGKKMLTNPFVAIPAAGVAFKAVQDTLSLPVLAGHMRKMQSVGFMSADMTDYNWVRGFSANLGLMPDEFIVDVLAPNAASINSLVTGEGFMQNRMNVAIKTSHLMERARKDPAINNIGLNNQEIGKYLAITTDFMIRQGQITSANDMNDRQLVETFSSISNFSNDLAKSTGVSRKEMLDQIMSELTSAENQASILRNSTILEERGIDPAKANIEFHKVIKTMEAHGGKDIKPLVDWIQATQNNMSAGLTAMNVIPDSVNAMFAQLGVNGKADVQNFARNIDALVGNGRSADEFLKLFKQEATDTILAPNAAGKIVIAGSEGSEEQKLNMAIAAMTPVLDQFAEVDSEMTDEEQEALKYAGGMVDVANEAGKLLARGMDTVTSDYDMLRDNIKGMLGFGDTVGKTMDGLSAMVSANSIAMIELGNATGDVWADNPMYEMADASDYSAPALAAQQQIHDDLQERQDTRKIEQLQTQRAAGGMSPLTHDELTAILGHEPPKVKPLQSVQPLAKPVTTTTPAENSTQVPLTTTQDSVSSNTQTVTTMKIFDAKLLPTYSDSELITWANDQRGKLLELESMPNPNAATKKEIKSRSQEIVRIDQEIRNRKITTNSQNDNKSTIIAAGQDRNWSEEQAQQIRDLEKEARANEQEQKSTPTATEQFNIEVNSAINAGAFFTSQPLPEDVIPPAVIQQPQRSAAEEARLKRLRERREDRLYGAHVAQPAQEPNPVQPSAQQAGEDKYLYAMRYMIEKHGFTPEQAAGFAGNFHVESKLKTDETRGDGGKAHGIAQWHNDRRRHFRAMYGKPIAQGTLEEQLDFVAWELQNNEAWSRRKLEQAGFGTADAGSSAALIDKYYERSSGAHRGQRVAYANQLMDQYGDELYKVYDQIQNPVPGVSTIVEDAKKVTADLNRQNAELNNTVRTIQDATNRINAGAH